MADMERQSRCHLNAPNGPEGHAVLFFLFFFVLIKLPT